MHGTVITVIEGEVPFKTVFQHIASRLHLVPRYRQRLALVPFNLAHPKWVDDPEFDLANHVICHRLAEGSSLDDAIAATLGLHESMLPRNRPLWRIYVFEGIENHTVLAQMGHHAMVDGASGVDISLVLFDLQKDARQLDVASWEPAPMPTRLELASEAAIESMRNLTENLTRMKFLQPPDYSSERTNTLRRATQSVTRLLSEPVVAAPWNAAPVGLKRDFLWRKYPFSDFRRIRGALGGTINDVVLATVAEGAVRYLHAHNQCTLGQHMRIMCPVNVRTEDEHGTLGNRISAIFPKFVAEPMETPERLRRIRRETEQIKNDREAQGLQRLLEALPGVPPVALAPTLIAGTPWDPTAFWANVSLPVLPAFGPRPPMPGFNFVCTNVPGVQTTQYLAGHRILDVIGFLMLTGNLGYGIVICSYNQNLYFNFTCDSRLMSDLDVMVGYVDEAFKELLAAAERANATASGGEEASGA